MKQIITLSALFLLASVSLSAQVVKGAGLWYFNGVPNVTPSTGTGTEVAYSINNKALYKWNRTTSAWVVVVQDSSITNELQDLILSGDTLSLTLSDSIVLMAQYRNHVWEIAALSDTTSITGDIEGDIAYVTGGDTIAFRDASYWLPFTGGGGGGTFNSFNIAGDTGSSVVTDGQTVTVAGGYGINTVESGGTVTVTADTSQLATQSDISGFGTMSSFTVAGGSGTPQTITNGNTLTLSEGYGINTLAAATDNVQTEVDTTQIATQFDISGLPSGSGTNQRIVVWTGTNSQGNSTQLQSAAGVTLDANLAYRITGGTTASRPTGAAGMLYYNTSNNWFDLHNGTSWFNPVRSATATGLGTNTRVGVWNTSGLLEGTTALTYSDGLLSVAPTTSVSGPLVWTIDGAATNNTNVRGGFGIYGSSGNRVGGFQKWSSSTQEVSFVTSVSGGYLTFRTDASVERIRILSTGEVGIGTNSPDRLLHPELSGSATTTIGYPFRASHITSGTAAAGFGAGIEFEAESAGGTNRVSASIENPYTTATNAAEVSDLVFKTMRAGTLTESLRSLGNGTLQIGTLSGTATQLMGATSTNIATAVTLGAGLSFSSGTLNGAFLPLTLTGATEVNTAGQTLRIRDAAGYPDVFMNSNYWTAASDVNTFIDVGSTSGQMQLNSAGRTIIAAAGNAELQAAVELRLDADSIMVEATLPVNTNATHVLVRDVSTQRLEEKALSSFGNGIISALPAGDVSIDGSGNDFDIQTATTGLYASNASFSKNAGLYEYTNSSTGVVYMYGQRNSGPSGEIYVGLETVYPNNGTDTACISFLGSTPGVARLALMQSGQIRFDGQIWLDDITNGDATTITAFNADQELTSTTLAASLTLSGGELSVTQSFFNDYDASITLTGVTTTPDTIDADSNTKSNDWGFNPTTNTYTYNGTTGRYYKVSVSGQVNSFGSTGESVFIQVYRNGSATSARAQAFMSGALETTAMHGQTILLLTNGDTINALIGSSAAGGADFDLENYSLILEQL
jgi:hypothetical protein